MTQGTSLQGGLTIKTDQRVLGSTIKPINDDSYLKTYSLPKEQTFSWCLVQFLAILDLKHIKYDHVTILLTFFYEVRGRSTLDLFEML